MPKAPKNKKRATRLAPTAADNSKDPAPAAFLDDVDDDDGTHATDASFHHDASHSHPGSWVLEQMDGENAEDRVQALNALANIINDEHSALGTLLSMDCLRRLRVRLADPECECRIAASGCVRNALLLGGDSIVDTLIRLDYLALLLPNLATSLTTLQAALSGASLTGVPIPLPPTSNGNGDLCTGAPSTFSASALADSTGDGDQAAEQLAHAEVQLQQQQQQQQHEQQQQQQQNVVAQASRLATETLAVLWVLCTSSDAVAKAVTAANVVPSVLSTVLRCPPSADEELHVSAAHFLQTISDSNATVAQQIASSVPDASAVLLSLIARTDVSPQLRILIADVAFQLSLQLQPSPVLSLLPHLMPVLVECLSLRPGERILAVASPAAAAAATATQAVTSESGEEELPPAPVIDQYVVHQLQRVFEAQQVALELLANLCSALTEEAEDGDENNNGDESEWQPAADEDAAVAAADTTAAPHQNTNDRITLDEATTQLLVQHNIPTLALALCALPPAAVLQCVQLQPALSPLLLNLSECNATALRAVANLIQAIPSSALGDFETLWHLLVGLCAESSNHAPELLEPASAAVWAVLRCAPTPPSITAVELQGIVAFASTGQDAVRAHCIAALALLAAHPTHAEVVVPLLPGVITRAVEDGGPAALAEALNVVFDLFADHYRSVFDASGLVVPLQQLLPRIRQMLHEQRGAVDPAVLERLDEARINLRRFLTYIASPPT